MHIFVVHWFDVIELFECILSFGFLPRGLLQVASRFSRSGIWPPACS